MQKLYLLPNLLHEESLWTYTPPHLDALIAESEKGGWRFLKKFKLPQVPTYILNEHTPHPSDLVKIKEFSVGLISDAGLPCLADPGTSLVAAARRHGISIEAIPGPCSITRALQLSGLTGQAFMFHGYFPKDDLASKIRTLQPNMAHIFIETPYRTEKVFHLLLKILHPQDQLCLALELMSPKERVETHCIETWKKTPPLTGKPRAVFIIQRG